MSDYIDNQNKIFEKIQKLFENNRKYLIVIQKKLENDFDEILKLYSSNYFLIAKNDFSVNPTKYYHLKSRVKEPHSFKEKLYRKNLGLQITNKYSLTTRNFNTNHNKVKESIYLLDDIIGVRIVTELKYDCSLVYKLLTEKNNFFIDRNIVFNKKELEKQPETMKNGLPIFRIKGVYKKKYGFELQIKSKIDEAWGDMDHSIFYKDYSISPVKNTVQVTMNNIGHLLDQIENLLLGIRSSEGAYKEKKEEIDFLNELSGSVFKEIKNKLGDNYDLSNIASSIKFIKHKTKVKASKSEVKNLSFAFLNYEVKDQRLKDYIKNRNLNFELLILESLYWYWKKKSDDNFKLNSNNYNNKLTEFIETLRENLLLNTKNLIKLDFIEITKDFVFEVIQNYCSEVQKKSLFLNPETIYKLQIIDVFVTDGISEYIEKQKDSTANDIKSDIRDIYFRIFLNLNISDSINNIRIKLIDNFDYTLINDFTFQINKFIQKQLNSYKITDNDKSLKEVRFLEDFLLEVLNNIKNNES